MDFPTRVGLGGAALFTLAGISAPIFGWWVSGPIMAVCTAIATWGLWPIVHQRFSAIQRWLTREPRRNRSLASSKQPRVGAWPDFKKWDQREKFELYEPACLWFHREPVLPMPRNAQEKYQEWKRMILGARLSIIGLTLRDDIEIAM